MFINSFLQKKKLNFNQGGEASFGIKARDLIGSRLYPVFKKGGEKLGFDDEESLQVYRDVRNYIELLDEEGKLSYFQADKDRKNDIEEILTHSLFSYRVGDTKLKRAAIQAKDATQAALYSGLSDFRAVEAKKNELGDLKNNKAGFKLRDKFGNDELSAMYKLADMIEKNDDSLSYTSGSDFPE